MILTITIYIGLLVVTYFVSKMDYKTNSVGESLNDNGWT